MNGVGSRGPLFCIEFEEADDDDCVVAMAEAGTNLADWQTGLKYLSQRANHILCSSQWSDCSFLVGNENNQKVRLICCSLCQLENHYSYILENKFTSSEFMYSFIM